MQTILSYFNQSVFVNENKMMENILKLNALFVKKDIVHKMMENILKLNALFVKKQTLYVKQRPRCYEFSKFGMANGF